MSPAPSAPCSEDPGGVPREPKVLRFPNRRAMEAYSLDRFPRSAAGVCSGSMRASPFAFAPVSWENRDHSARSAWGWRGGIALSLLPAVFTRLSNHAIGQIPDAETSRMHYATVLGRREIVDHGVMSGEYEFTNSMNFDT